MKSKEAQMNIEGSALLRGEKPNGGLSVNAVILGEGI